MKKKIKKLTKLENKFIRSVRKNIAIAISGAFALVIALSWNDAIQEGVNRIVVNLGIPQSAYLYKILAAAAVTIIAVVGIMIFSRWAEKK